MSDVYLQYINVTHSLEAVQVVVQSPEALPCVVAAISPAHQKLQYQANIDQCDLVIWGEVPLQHKNQTSSIGKKLHQEFSTLYKIMFHFTFFTSLTTNWRVLAGPSFWKHNQKMSFNLFASVRVLFIF